MKQLTPQDNREGALDMLGLAMNLIGAGDIDAVLQKSARFFHDMRPRAGWAVLIEIAPGRYVCEIAGRVGEDDLRPVIADACGDRAIISNASARSLRRVRGRATWIANSPADGVRVVVACWPGIRRLQKHERRMLETAAGIVSSAAKAAIDVESLIDHSYRDALTKLLNRRGILDFLRRENARVRRSSGSLSVLFIDLDRFKEINDLHSHAVGDELLQGVASRMHAELRQSDAIGRLGGDEFLIVLPDTDRAGAGRIGERLARHLRKAAIPTSAGELRISLTFGAASGSEEFTEEGLIDRADRRMLAGKKHHRKQQELAQVPVSVMAVSGRG